jgi:hypothetical protein
MLYQTLSAPSPAPQWQNSVGPNAHPPSPWGLLQVDGQMDSVVYWPKDEVTDSRARILETQALLCMFQELGNDLPYNVNLKDFNIKRPSVIPHFEIAGTKPPYVCPGCFIHMYSNNMITDSMFSNISTYSLQNDPWV